MVRKLWHILLEKKYSIEKMKQVADDLGLRNPNGKKLVKSKIHCILKNPFYYGDILWNDELHHGKHEPMISKVEFEAAQKILSSRYKARSHYKLFAFTGLLRCGECGAGITAESKSKTQKNGNVHHYTYYRCSKGVTPLCTQKTIREEKLEAQIMEIFGNITIPAEFHEWAIKNLKEEQAKEVEDREKISQAQRNAFDSCRRHLDNLLNMRLNNEINAEEFKQRKAELAIEKERFEELIEDANHRADTWLDRAEKVLEFAETAKKRFETGDLEAKRDILSSLGSSLILKNRTLSLRLNPPLELVKSVAPEVQDLHENLEPIQVPATQGTYDVIYSQNENWGGRRDLNPRPSEPQSDALTKLSYAHQKALLRKQGNYNTLSEQFFHFLQRSLPILFGGIQTVIPDFF